MFHQEMWFKNMVPKVPYSQLGLRCDSARLPPPDADRERVRRFIIALHFLRDDGTYVHSLQSAKKSNGEISK
jgi:hypothetical protein